MKRVVRCLYMCEGVGHTLRAEALKCFDGVLQAGPQMLSLLHARHYSDNVDKRFLVVNVGVKIQDSVTPHITVTD